MQTMKVLSTSILMMGNICLAAGINLPEEAIVFRAPMVQKDILNIGRFVKKDKNFEEVNRRII